MMGVNNLRMLFLNISSSVVHTDVISVNEVKTDTSDHLEMDSVEYFINYKR